MNTKDNNGMNAIMSASHNGHLTIVEYLLNHGGDVNAQTKDGLTAMIYACGNGEKEIVECLVKHGCDIEKKDREGRTGLFAAVAGGHRNVVRYVMENGGEVGMEDKNGKKAMDVGRIGGDEWIVEYLRLHEEGDADGDSGGGKGGMGGGEEVEKDGNVTIDTESGLYRFIIKHHRMPKFTGYYCDECHHNFMEDEIRYHCLECDDFDLCEDCVQKTEFVNSNGHQATHEYKRVADE